MKLGELQQGGRSQVGVISPKCGKELGAGARRDGVSQDKVPLLKGVSVTCNSDHGSQVMMASLATSVALLKMSTK